jgi:hypothetical protein
MHGSMRRREAPRDQSALPCGPDRLPPTLQLVSGAGRVAVVAQGKWHSTEGARSRLRRVVCARRCRAAGGRWRRAPVRPASRPERGPRRATIPSRRSSRSSRSAPPTPTPPGRVRERGAHARTHAPRPRDLGHPRRRQWRRRPRSSAAARTSATARFALAMKQTQPAELFPSAGHAHMRPRSISVGIRPTSAPGPPKGHRVSDIPLRRRGRVLPGRPAAVTSGLFS